MSVERLDVLAMPGVCVVKLDGDIDIVAVAGLDQEILQRTRDVPTVVLDLTGVTFLDSAGIRLIDTVVGANQRAGQATLVVAPPGSAARFTLDLCVFRPDLITDTLPEALGSAG